MDDNHDSNSIHVSLTAFFLSTFLLFIAFLGLV